MQPILPFRSLFALRPLSVFSLGTLLLVSPLAAQRKTVPDYELPPVGYSKATPDNVVAKLQRRIDAGEISFTQTGRELLLTLLQALHVPVESQMFVFSKTSLQKELIRPETPRVLFFSDQVYIGWVPGGLIEVAAIDPQLGPVFYHFKANAPAGVPKRFERDAGCMLCHGYFFIRDIPALLALSVNPDSKGELLPYSDFDLVDDTTPFARRWGGWYVTGYTGAQNHRGNGFGSGEGRKAAVPANDKRPSELSEFFDTSRYPQGTSDALNLLILEHQIGMYNTLTRAGQDARLGNPSSERDIVDRLLFRRAASLPIGVQQNAAFVKAFLAETPRSKAGDALKDLQIDGRLFRNRCSYLIYSDAFAALPAELKTRVFALLFDALQNSDPAQRYSYLEPAEKKRIFEILMETHAEARQHFQNLAAQRGS